MNKPSRENMNIWSIFTLSLVYFSFSVCLTSINYGTLSLFPFALFSLCLWVMTCNTGKKTTKEEKTTPGHAHTKHTYDFTTSFEMEIHLTLPWIFTAPAADSGKDRRPLCACVCSLMQVFVLVRYRYFTDTKLKWKHNKTLMQCFHSRGPPSRFW